MPAQNEVVVNRTVIESGVVGKDMYHTEGNIQTIAVDVGETVVFVNEVKPRLNEQQLQTLGKHGIDGRTVLKSDHDVIVISESKARELLQGKPVVDSVDVLRQMRSMLFPHLIEYNQ